MFTFTKTVREKYTHLHGILNGGQKWPLSYQALWKLELSDWIEHKVLHYEYVVYFGTWIRQHFSVFPFSQCFVNEISEIFKAVESFKNFYPAVKEWICCDV